MEVYVIRHAIAVDINDPAVSSDAERWLTEEGIEKMKKAACGLLDLIDGLDCIYTSPYRRARETAEIVADAFDAKLKTIPSLQPGVDFNEVAGDLGSSPGERIALVGHEPDLSGLIAMSISGMKHPSIQMKKGATARVDFAGAFKPGMGTLIWHLQPKQLRQFAR